MVTVLDANHERLYWLDEIQLPDGSWLCRLARPAKAGDLMREPWVEETKQSVYREADPEAGETEPVLIETLVTNRRTRRTRFLGESDLDALLSKQGSLFPLAPGGLV